MFVGVYRRFELENTPYLKKTEFLLKENRALRVYSIFYVLYTPFIVKNRRKKKGSRVVEEWMALYTLEIEISSCRIEDLR